jgi:hypothetical protein
MSIIVNNTDNQLNINNNGVLDVYAVRSIKSVSRAVDAFGNYYIAINFIANDKNNSLRIYLSNVSSPVTWTNDLTGANAALSDIRDWLAEIIEVQISEANDSILVYGWDGTTNRKIKTDANGELQVDVLTMPATFAEDTAHTSGNTGAFVLGVRNDANAAMTSADGDYSPIAVNNKGAVAIQDGGNSITVDGGTGTQRTPNFLRVTNTNGTIALGTFSMSFASVGTANAIVGGIILKPGETLNFDAGAINNTLAAVTYNTVTNAGSELIIITLT